LKALSERLNRVEPSPSNISVPAWVNQSSGGGPTWNSQSKSNKSVTIVMPDASTSGINSGPSAATAAVMEAVSSLDSEKDPLLPTTSSSSSA
jgi:hypothetical protein